jgi:hypothetical protein
MSERATRRLLKGLLECDTEAPWNPLAKLIGHVTLRRDADRLVAELRGNFPGLVVIHERQDNPGAGRGILFERQARVRVA